MLPNSFGISFVLQDILFLLNKNKKAFVDKPTLKAGLPINTFVYKFSLPKKTGFCQAVWGKVL
jgi:hypothetical protein